MSEMEHEPSVPVVEVPKKFEIMLYVPQFFPWEVLVRIFNKKVYIEGKHEEHADDHGFVSRKFSKIYNLPDYVKEDNLIVDFTSDGVVIIREMVKGYQQEDCQKKDSTDK